MSTRYGSMEWSKMKVVKVNHLLNSLKHLSGSTSEWAEVVIEIPFKLDDVRNVNNTTISTRLYDKITELMKRDNLPYFSSYQVSIEETWGKGLGNYIARANFNVAGSKNINLYKSMIRE